jgi:hypothetical protein
MNPHGWVMAIGLVIVIGALVASVTVACVALLVGLMRALDAMTGSRRRHDRRRQPTGDADDWDAFERGFAAYVAERARPSDGPLRGFLGP